jgi:hypothetical protein
LAPDFILDSAFFAVPDAVKPVSNLVSLGESQPVMVGVDAADLSHLLGIVCTPTLLPGAILLGIACVPKPRFQPSAIPARCNSRRIFEELARFAKDGALVRLH